MSAKENIFIKWLTGILVTTLLPFMIIGVVNIIRMDTVLKMTKQTIEKHDKMFDTKLNSNDFMLYLKIQEEKTQVFSKAFSDHVSYDMDKFNALQKQMDTLNARINNLQKRLLE